MHVGVAVFFEQLQMGGEWIMHFHFGAVFFGEREGVFEAGLVSDGDAEIVELVQDAGIGFAGGERDDGGFAGAVEAFGIGGAARAGVEEGFLQKVGREAGADVGEIAGGGVAAGAAAFAVEIGFAGFGVAGDEVQDLIAATVGGELVAGFEKGRDVGDLGGRGGGEGGHAFVGAAVEDDGADVVAVVVVEDEGGADEIGAALAAFGVGAVAEAAGGDEFLFAAFDGGGVRRFADGEEFLEGFDFLGVGFGDGWGLLG